MAACAATAAAAAIRRCTKLVATVGPASSSADVMSAIINGGVDVVRLNFSHGTHAEHEERISLVRECAEQAGRHVALLQDLCGPKIRTTPNEEDCVLELEAGAMLKIVSSADVKGHTGSCGTPTLGTIYEALAQDIHPGARVLLSDGRIQTSCVDVDGDQITCKVLNGGPLKGSQGINLPDVNISASSITKKDVADLEFGMSMGVDFVAVSFVRCAADMELVRSHMIRLGRTAPLIAKVEMPQAVNNLDQLVDASDGIMVARGDLGVELPPEVVPIAQKRIIAAANEAGKPVIVATQMLESMITNPTPTRAEVSDVCNAIFDGADACMLSAESAAGAYPVESVEMMARIATHSNDNAAVDASIIEQRGGLIDHRTVSEGIGYAAAALGRSTGAKAIVTFTHTGRSAMDVVRTKPGTPVVALADTEEVCRRLNVCRGVVPLHCPIVTTALEATMVAEEIGLKNGLFEKGDLVVICGGHPVTAVFGETNFVKVHKVGTL